LSCILPFVLCEELGRTSFSQTECRVRYFNLNLLFYSILGFSPTNFPEDP
jgi:hypothetical protein